MAFYETFLLICCRSRLHLHPASSSANFLIPLNYLFSPCLELNLDPVLIQCACGGPVGKSSRLSHKSGSGTMPLATRITKMLNIEHPVVMGGMTGTGTPELAAAVSNAGGLGLFAVLNAGTPEKCRAWIKLMPTLTDKPW